jgi:hypothetical protein
MFRVVENVSWALQGYGFVAVLAIGMHKLLGMAMGTKKVHD